MNCVSYIMLKCEITAIEAWKKGYYPDIHIKALKSQSEQTVSRPKCGPETYQNINSATSKPRITVHT
jgi:hypothetical protein